MASKLTIIGILFYALHWNMIGQIQPVYSHGEIVPWEQAKKIIPKYSKFTLTDLETGFSFHVQRRAGSNHADVQPLTKEDTKTMKEIYNGRWSWNRKAVIVETEGKRIAASMHGMPHGGDGIPDNDFSGHFCIHFLGSTTHRSGLTDPAHQLMVYKAGGKLTEYFSHITPYEFVEAFVIALQHQDAGVLKLMFAASNMRQLEFFSEEMMRLNGISLAKQVPRREVSDLLAIDIPIQVNMNRKGSHSEKLKMIVSLRRTSLSEAWKIDYISLFSAQAER